MKPIIRVENLGKRYRIGAQQQPGHTSLRDALAGAVRAPLRRLRGGGHPNNGAKDIWALRDVNFEVARGARLGIIGRNGAGKSTLLKILSRITKPTTGRVRLRGRVGSLLEVGTGFHSELTGRENVYLNGAILGMKRDEIARKFDEIVAFSEVEQFLDTPVKHYSSGMTVRLAFAVAAHLEPEILIIDEVLAVGDIAFQKKCLGKMNDIAREGRTVLFVSHDLSAVNALCETSILMHGGSIVMEGATRDVAAHYLDRANRLYSPVTWAKYAEGQSDEVVLHAVEVVQHDTTTSAIDCRAPFQIRIAYENRRAVRGARFFIIIRNAKGDALFSTSDYDALTTAAAERRTGHFTSTVNVPGDLLRTGSYYGTVGADIKNERIIFVENDILHFDAFESGDDTLAERHTRPGLIAPVLAWDIREAGTPSPDS